MSTRTTRLLGGLLLLALPTAYVALRAAPGGPEAAPAPPAPEPVSRLAAGKGPAAADSVRKPPRPPRPVTPGVELVVNIPSGRLELFDGDSLVRSYPVSVGSARYATPQGSYAISRIIYNPWWHPPKESEWARRRKPEAPGPRNPMGRAKLHISELYYIHGTTSEGRLGAPASHGCIRMANRDVVDLARRIQQYSDPEITTARLDALVAADRTTREIVMPRSVRLRVSYQVAMVRRGKLHVYPDVYGRTESFAGQVRGELARAGHDSTVVTAEGMRVLRFGASSRGGASYALADLPSLRWKEPEIRLLGSEVRVLGTEVVRPAPADATPADSAAVGQAAPRPDTLAVPGAQR